MVARTLLFLKESRARRVAAPFDTNPSFSSGKSARTLLFLDENMIHDHAYTQFCSATTPVFSMEKRRGSFSFLKKLLAEHVEHGRARNPLFYNGKCRRTLVFLQEIPAQDRISFINQRRRRQFQSKTEGLGKPTPAIC